LASSVLRIDIHCPVLPAVTPPERIRCRLVLLRRFMKRSEAEAEALTFTYRHGPSCDVSPFCVYTSSSRSEAKRDKHLFIRTRSLRSLRSSLCFPCFVATSECILLTNIVLTQKIMILLTTGFLVSFFATFGFMVAAVRTLVRKYYSRFLSFVEDGLWFLNASSYPCRWCCILGDN
jgi:hypothetical protein